MSAAGAATENFADMLAESFGANTSIEGSVVRGFVVSLEGDAAIIDVGLKSEGRVPLKELAGPGQEPNVNVGDEIEVYVERMDCLLYTSPSPRDRSLSRMPSSA